MTSKITNKILVDYTSIREPGLPCGGLFVLSTKDGHMVVRGPATTSVATIEQWSIRGKKPDDVADALLARAVSLLRSTKTALRVVLNAEQTELDRALYINGFSKTLSNGLRREYTKKLL